jgi:hypothetical protein
MLKGRIKGHLRVEIYWFAKQVNGRRSMVSLEARDYVEAVQRAREIMDAPELQPAQSARAEVERFLKHKYETNGYSKMSADKQALLSQPVCRRCEEHPADKRHRPPVQGVLQYGKSAHRREHGGKLPVHAALILQLVREGKSMPAQSRSRCST